MKPLKIPGMTKPEYDALIERQFISRIAFSGADHPYIAPFMYVFDKKYLYFLSTKYGRKMEYFAANPKVSVQIEEYRPDLSCFTFVSLQGKIEEVVEPKLKRDVREQFVAMMKRHQLSPRALSALGYSPDDPPEIILDGDRSAVWKLVGVKDIVALKNG
jgi:nitroimidazol reductase NimA-like FMN-containing flavoprotein (pyridoxamine 5'-phosphate oxidase superfamily)